MMDESRNRAEIITLRCANDGGLVALRTEEMVPGSWTVTWTFSIEAGTEFASSRPTAEGSFSIAPGIPACTRCSAPSLVKCGNCQNVTCFNDSTKGHFVCAWCEQSGIVEGVIDSLNVTGDV